LDAKIFHRFDYFTIELCAAIKDQVTRRRVVGKCLAQLLNYPGARRMLGHIAVKDTPPVMRNDEEAVENAKGEHRNGEEVHCSNCFTVVVQKSLLSLCRLRIPRSFPHPALNTSLGDVEAKHPQLTVNPRRAPGGIVGDHAEDEFAQFSAHALSSHSVPMPRKPRPVQLESCLMPANDGRRLDENQCRFPSRPKPPQCQPEQVVGSRNRG